ncbi:MAG: hypothetical protein V2J62_12405 [candidate division KSB1 bacterium]|nr:hypothetical protein [candidate division KSB1 bacterium]
MAGGRECILYREDAKSAKIFVNHRGHKGHREKKNAGSQETGQKTEIGEREYRKRMAVKGSVCHPERSRGVTESGKDVRRCHSRMLLAGIQ